MPGLCAPAGVLAMSMPAAATAPQSKAKTNTLLLVDDEPSVLSALRRLFRMHGYAIEQAPGGAEALALMAERDFDLVISDMRMPEMDGAAFLEQVRQRHPATVRILLTGYADIESTVAAINRGEIHRYLTKPWDDNDLLLVVSEALKRRDLEQQNQALMALTQQQNQALQDLNRTLEARVASRTAELEQINQLLESAYEEVNRNFTMAITVFSGLLEMRQDGIAGHSRRVGEIARRMAERLTRNERERRDIYLAALLHDVGEIGFTDAMLKTLVSKYNPEELTRYRRHGIDGEAALMPLDQLHGVALIVRQHHERVDGRGFPDALTANDITLGAKIVSAAGDYDDLLYGALSEHSYSREQARQALQGGVGSHYDAQVVATLLQVLVEMDGEAVADEVVALNDLRPQMVLSADLLSPKGSILLPKGHVFDALVIKKLLALTSRSDIQLVVRVLRNSMPAAGTVKPLRVAGAH
jgi:response regulator RpfG family c-di-GMP phosphodiesterase